MAIINNPVKTQGKYLSTASLIYFYALYVANQQILKICCLSRAVQETTFDLEGDIHSGTGLPASKVRNCH